MSMKAVPYFSQWESRQLVSDFLSGKLHPADDPLWHLSGAIDRDEYARWLPYLRDGLFKNAACRLARSDYSNA